MGVGRRDQITRPFWLEDIVLGKSLFGFSVQYTGCFHPNLEKRKRKEKSGKLSPLHHYAKAITIFVDVTVPCYFSVLRAPDIVLISHDLKGSKQASNT